MFSHVIRMQKKRSLRFQEQELHGIRNGSEGDRHPGHRQWLRREKNRYPDVSRANLIYKTPVSELS
jgi:hypothetical protein